MKKTTLDKAVNACKDETRQALQTVFDALNHGQQNKLLKDDAVRELFDRFGVSY